VNSAIDVFGWCTGNKYMNFGGLMRERECENAMNF
jgi:hypothetical protein